jgi:putative tryptophan/tyrosine transport system substrate-binding protein
MAIKIARRKFIAALGGASLAWPFAARAQQSDRVRHISVLVTGSQDDPDSVARSESLRQALQRLGWIDGGNLQIDIRWSVAAADRVRAVAAELAKLTPDVIVAGGAALVAPLLQATRTIPIVFVLVADPVGAGFVDSLSHPGGNATGFTAVEYGFGGKWLELLKELAPKLTRVAVIRDPTISAGIGLFGAIQSTAPSLGLEVVPIAVRDAAQIERDMDAFAHGLNDGLLVTASALAYTHRDLIVALADRHKLPAVYFARPFVASGGLAAYTLNISEEYRLAAGYVDRILKGEKPADLPVQNPTKYELIINLKTAKALGLTIPQAVLARADEVIE